MEEVFVSKELNFYCSNYRFKILGVFDLLQFLYILCIVVTLSLQVYNSQSICCKFQAQEFDRYFSIPRKETYILNKLCLNCFLEIRLQNFELIVKIRGVVIWKEF
eukprot:TRINITY_DN2449_c0_g1_i2.p3 TRINITY_DN2449_c0_g1~~TRINITY_DN2449_c0_g1_i2.p3  ORF type:complete len:105 (+),score=2.02 TRINITY_DN2449_c0_g1_i2:39-353(+)